MLLDARQSCLFVVDLQQKLTPLVVDSQQLVDNCCWMIKLARELDIDVLVSEHYPKGLGSCVDKISQWINPSEVIDKVHFSCAAEQAIVDRVNQLKRPQIVIIGIESHVCVLQTAIEFQLQGKQVFVVSDCISSRNVWQHEFALARMRQVGVQILSREMVFFEWLHRAATPKFKLLSKEFIR